jgi:hypothetical protein
VHLPRNSDFFRNEAKWRKPAIRESYTFSVGRRRTLLGAPRRLEPLRTAARPQKTVPHHSIEGIGPGRADAGEMCPDHGWALPGHPSERLATPRGGGRLWKCLAHPGPLRAALCPREMTLNAMLGGKGPGREDVGVRVPASGGGLRRTRQSGSRRLAGKGGLTSAPSRPGPLRAALCPRDTTLNAMLGGKGPGGRMWA